MQRVGSASVCLTLAGLPLASIGTGCRDGHAAAETREASDAGAAPSRPRYEQTREHVTRLAAELLPAHHVTGASLAPVERGQLDLDQTLAELVPELRLAEAAEQQITLAQLLAHQSGLQSDATGSSSTDFSYYSRHGWYYTHVWR